MTAEQQRIAIAELCGWTDLRIVDDFLQPQIKILEGQNYEYFQGLGYHEVPDYLSDLNAMADARKSISHNNRCVFINKLINTVGPDGETQLIDDYGNASTSPSTSVFALVDATAAQQAETLLKTLGLWTDK
jgi:hypothetical protein